MDHEYDVLDGYVPAFVQHVNDTRARLGIRIESQDQNSAGGAVEEVTDSHADDLSFNWTPAEHDAFFRALSVHSRWRPDLIAACVPTKTEWEVWTYLEVLEEGAATLAVQRGDEDVDMESGVGDDRRDVDMHVDGSCSYARSFSSSDTDEDGDGDGDVCEPALEVSQAWIDVEERMAAWIVHQEHLASVEGDAAGDTEAVVDPPPKRKRGRPRKARKGHAQSRVRGQTVSNDGDYSPSPLRCSPSPEPTSTSARQRSRDPSTSTASKREALMGCLEVPHLLVLDNILREGEEAIKDKSKSREGSVTVATLTEPGDEGIPRSRDVEVSSLSDRITAPQEMMNVSGSTSNVVIDPVLLGLSGGADPAGRQSGRGPSENTLAAYAPAHVPTQGLSSSPNASSQPMPLEAFSQPGTSNMSTLSLDNTALTDPNPTADVESDLSLFSPRSRRRIQKRLYMRRKRALLYEKGATSGGVIDPGIGKLKPGKKAKAKPSETPVVSTSVPCSEAPSDAEMELTENVSKKSKGGLTLPYKLKARFAELGIDAAYLRGQGVDLLNLSVVGRLMGLYSSLEQGEEEADGSAVAQSIDAQLLRHLQAAVVSFVTDMMHRAIVWREREIRLKQRSQVWRQGDQITIGAIEHAVEAVGARYHSHKEYFESLGALHGFPTEPASAPANASGEPNASDASADRDVEAADRAADPPGLSRHRDVYTPLVRPPSACKLGPLACLTRTYEQEATRTRRGPSAELDEEELMSDETDEEALEAELQEEDEADVLDMELAVTHERALWASINF